MLKWVSNYKAKLDKKFIRESYKHLLTFDDLNSHKVKTLKKHLSSVEYLKLVSHEYVKWVDSLSIFDNKTLKLVNSNLKLLNLKNDHSALSAVKRFNENREVFLTKIKNINTPIEQDYYKFKEVKSYSLKGNWVRLADVYDMTLTNEYIIFKSLGSGFSKQLPYRQITKITTEKQKIFIQLINDRGMILIYSNPKAIVIALNKIRMKHH